jgi:DNA polymerase V
MAICGERLRRQKSCAKLIIIFLHTNNFRTQDKQYYRSINVQLPTATNSTKELIHYAMMGLDKIFKPGFNFKKVGVLAQDLVPEDQVQQNLFSEADLERDARLMKALDSINQHFSNKQTVRFAIQGNGQKWKLRQEKLSACFTTRVPEILKAKVGNV